MSFSGSNFSVGTLTAQFTLDAAAATAQITNITGQITALKSSFATPNTLNVNTSAATASLNKTRDAAIGLKTVLESIGILKAFDLLGEGVKALGGAMVGTNARIEQATTSITALTGNAATAAEMVGKLETLAAHSTFGLPQLTQSAQQLLAFGVAAKNVPPLLQAIQTAAAASGGDITDKLSRINYVIAELNSGIPLSARQLRQLATAGVPLEPLAKQLGVTVEELMTAGKTGKVTSEQLVTAFQKVYTEGKLGDFMQKQAGTFGGAMNLIKTNLNLAAAQAFKPLFDVISSLVVKFGLFVQTQTFGNWVAQVQQGVTAVIDIFKTLASILGPIGKAFADLFGLKTDNIGAEMDAVKNATVDVGQYDASVQEAGKTTEDTKAKTADYKREVADASRALLGINKDLAANKVALDDNAQAIERVKNQYDPLIKAAEASMKAINTLSPEELRRKKSELDLDKEKAALQLTKPDVSGFDTAIAGNRAALDAMPRLDTTGWDATIRQADNQLRDFNTKAYTGGIQSKIDAVQDSDPAAPFKAVVQNIQDAMSQLDPEEATKGITQTIQGIRDHIASLDPEEATKGITRTIQSIQDAMRALDPQAATQGLTSQIDAIKSAMSALDPAAATSGITSQIQAIQDEIHGLNTSELDEKIQHVRDAISQPAPDTSGLKNQLAALSAEIQGAGAGADTSALRSQYASVSAQKLGVEQKYTGDQTGLKGQLSLLERQRSDTRLAQAETKRADEARIIDLKEQAKAITDGIAEQRKAMQEQVVGLESQKKAITEGLADQRKAMQERIVGLEREKKETTEGIADQKKADEARIVGLTRQAAAIKEGIADERKADEEKIRGLNRQAAAATAAKAEELKGLHDLLAAAQERAAADRKVIEDRRAAAQQEKSDAQGADAEKRQGYNDAIHQQETLKAAMLAPYNQQLAGIDKQQEQNRLLDDTAAAQRKLDLAPWLAQLDEAKTKEADELAPLQAKKQLLDDAKTALDEQKTAQTLVRQEAEANAKALKDGAANAGLLGDSLKNNVAPAMQKIIDSYDVQGDSPIVTQLKKLQSWLEEHKTDISGALKTQWDLAVKNTQEMADAIGKIFTIGQDVWRGDWKKFFFDIGLTQTNGETKTVTSVDEWGNTVTFKYQSLHKTWLNDRETFYKDLGLVDSKYYGNFKLLIGDFFSEIGHIAHTWWTHQTEEWGNFWSAVGSTFKKAIGADGSLTQFFKDWPGHITDALKGLDNLIGAPFQGAWGTVSNFFAEVSKAMEWLSKTFHLAGFSPFKSGVGDHATGGGPNGTDTLAKGTGGWTGGAAVVGEDGRELVSRKGDRNTGPLNWELTTGPTLMDLPTGAVVLPNHVTEHVLAAGVPGFAGGLNFDFDGIGNFVKSVGGLAKAGAGAVVDRMMGSFGDPGIDGILPGASGALLGQVKDGLLGWLKGSPDNRAPARAGGARGGGIAGAGELVAAILAATGDKAEQMAMLFGAFIESSGQNVAQRGGGPGAGYWQIEAGPGGQYAGRVDPYDAMAAARFMIPDYDAAMGYYDPSNLEGSLAQVVYHAERPAVFYSDDQIGGAWAAIQPMLVDGGIAAPASAPGFVGPSPWGSVVEQAMRHLSETQQANGITWNGWCEKFQADMDDAAGFGPTPRFGTAFLHGSSESNLSRAPAPAGASVWFDQSWGPAGHAAIATGSGNETISTPIADGHNDIHYADIIGSSGYMGWAPPGLAEGGYFPANDPRLAMIGEGRHDEIVAPIPMLKETLREVIRSDRGGTPITVNFESGAIVAGQHSSPVEVARAVVEEMQDRMVRERRQRGYAG